MPSSPSIFLTGGHPSARDHVARVLADIGVALCVDRAGFGADVVIALQSPGNALAALSAAKEHFRSSQLIFVAESGSEQLAVDAFRAGNNDYLTWPVTPAGITDSLRRLRVEPAIAANTPGFVGKSDSIETLRGVIRRIAATPCSVLIAGETGTGKEVVARLIHESGPRAPPVRHDLVDVSGPSRPRSAGHGSHDAPSAAQGERSVADAKQPARFRRRYDR